MIIIGYPGIGKSTIARRNNNFIDLESSNFRIDGERAANWYKPYCNIAEDLSQQGRIVFVSCHEEVREQLKHSSELVIVVYPALELQNEWIDRLRNRYNQTGSLKDKNALEQAKNNYCKNITMLENSNFDHKIILKHMNYDLEAFIIQMNNEIHGY